MQAYRNDFDNPLLFLLAHLQEQTMLLLTMAMAQYIEEDLVCSWVFALLALA